MRDPFITESERVWDKMCEASDMREAQLEELAKGILEDSVELARILDDCTVEIAELFSKHRGDKLDLGEVLDRFIMDKVKYKAESYLD